MAEFHIGEIRKFKARIKPKSERGNIRVGSVVFVTESISDNRRRDVNKAVIALD
jgi:hypothetical protein